MTVQNGTLANANEHQSIQNSWKLAIFGCGIPFVYPVIQFEKSIDLFRSVGYEIENKDDHSSKYHRNVSIILK